MKLIYAGVGLIASTRTIGVKARPQSAQVETITLDEQLGIFDPEPILTGDLPSDMGELIDDIPEEELEMDLTPILIEDNFDEPESQGPGDQAQENSDQEMTSGSSPSETNPQVTAPQKFIEPSGNVIPLQFEPPQQQSATGGYPTADSNFQNSNNRFQIPLNGYLNPNSFTQSLQPPSAPRQISPISYNNIKTQPVTSYLPPASTGPRPSRSQTNQKTSRPYVWRNNPVQTIQPPPKQGYYNDPLTAPVFKKPVWQSNYQGPPGSQANPYYIWKDPTLSPNDAASYEYDSLPNSNYNPYGRPNSVFSSFFNFRFGQPKVAPADDESPVYGMQADPSNKFWVSRCHCWKTCPEGFIWNYNKNRCSKDNLREPWGGFF